MEFSLPKRLYANTMCKNTKQRILGIINIDEIKELKVYYYKEYKVDRLEIWLECSFIVIKKYN